MIFFCNDWAPPDFTSQPEAILAIVTMLIKLSMKFIMQVIYFFFLIMVHIVYN